MSSINLTTSKFRPESKTFIFFVIFFVFPSFSLISLLAIIIIVYLLWKEKENFHPRKKRGRNEMNSFIFWPPRVGYRSQVYFCSESIPEGKLQEKGESHCLKILWLVCLMALTKLSGNTRKSHSSFDVCIEKVYTHPGMCLCAANIKFIVMHAWRKRRDRTNAVIWTENL